MAAIEGRFGLDRFQNIPIANDKFLNFFCSANHSSVSAAKLEAEYVLTILKRHKLLLLTICTRKDKATGGLLSLRFATSEALDVAADVYHGVCYKNAIVKFSC